MNRFPKSIIVDTGFWIGFYDKGDPYHHEARKSAYILEKMNVLLPWPCLYETFNTRFSKNKIALKQFEKLLKEPHVKRINDDPYREKALDAAFKTSIIQSRPISLVDMVIRFIIEDINVPKDAIITFNRKDFFDICNKHGIEIL